MSMRLVRTAQYANKWWVHRILKPHADFDFVIFSSNHVLLLRPALADALKMRTAPIKSPRQTEVTCGCSRRESSKGLERFNLIRLFWNVFDTAVIWQPGK